MTCARRLPAIDGLRGCLAMVVVAFHVSGARVLQPFAILAVLGFFVLSGWVLTAGWRGDLGAFLVRRLVRLWPVYAVCLLAGGAMLGVRVSPQAFLWVPGPHYEVFEVCLPAWTLFVEVWAAPLMPLVAWSGHGGRWRTVALVTGGLFSAVLLPSGLPMAFAAGMACFATGARLSGVAWRCAALEHPVAQWLGCVSYSLYLTHWVVLQVLPLWAAALAILPVGWAVWWAVERPSIAVSRTVVRGKGGKQAVLF